LLSVHQILNHVQKPSYYTGGEYGSVVKEKHASLLRYAFCFPDTYEIGMSYLGGKILYGLLNDIKDVWCERVYAPKDDMERLMRENEILLYGLESMDSLQHFHLLGFTLQTELNYTNVLNMLDLAGIPLLSAERHACFPLIHAGGPCAYNPEPMADFIDFFVIGEGEEVLPEIMDVVKSFIEQQEGDKVELLSRLAGIEGVYVPAFYEVQYREDGSIESFVSKHSNAKKTIQKRVVKDIDSVYYPEQVVVPHSQVVHDRVMLEMFRGCIRGCRFCQAGIIYKPFREKSPEVLNECAKRLIASTGYDEISLASLSSTDYSQLVEVCDLLQDWCEPNYVSLSLPSLRVDNFSMEVMERVQRVRRGGLTFAPEAGSQRMRDVINKQVTEEQLQNTCRIAFEGGWHTIKLYFMIGLPTETLEDVAQIADLAHMIVNTYYDLPGEMRGRGCKVTVSVATFIPKPFTPFQWAGQDSSAAIDEKIALLRSRLKSRRISLSYHDRRVSYVEAVLARGDRRLCSTILKAFRLGAKMDGWESHFNFGIWMNAFEQSGVDPDFFAARAKPEDETLPWDFIDCGVPKAYLLEEARRAQEAEVTLNCKLACSGCGADRLTGGTCSAKG